LSLLVGRLDATLEVPDTLVLLVLMAVDDRKSR